MSQELILKIVSNVRVPAFSSIEGRHTQRKLGHFYIFQLLLLYNNVSYVSKCISWDPGRIQLYIKQCNVFEM